MGSELQKIASDKIHLIGDRLRIETVTNIEAVSVDSFIKSVWKILTDEIPSLKKNLENLNKIGFTSHKQQELNYDTAIMKMKAESVFEYCYFGLRKNTDDGYKEMVDKILNEFKKD